MALTTYDGGKNADGVYHKIINNIAVHRRYFELFVGSGAIAQRKRPAERTYVTDLDETAVVEIRTAGIPRLVAKQMCAVEFMRTWREWRRDDFIYLDAPYLFESRASGRKIYRYEFGLPEQHEELLKAALDVSSWGAMVMISHYPSKLYDRFIGHWRKVEFTVGLNNGKTATEVLFMNYPQPDKLHDHRFLGENFRQREKIKRREKTIFNRLDRMLDKDPLTLHSYLATIEAWKKQRLTNGNQ